MDRTYRIAVLVGSLRKSSNNRLLARAVARLLPSTFQCEEVRLDDVPLYDQDLDGSPPPPAVRLKSAIEAAHAVVFATPEYNRSMPGVLKNAIDTASRPYGKSSFAGKPAGVLGTSPGAVGTALAQQHLRTVLAYLDMPTLGQPEVFLQWKDGLVDAEGVVTDERTRAFLQRWADAYAAWVRRLCG
jgi:chromate reductase